MLHVLGNIVYPAELDDIRSYQPDSIQSKPTLPVKGFLEDFGLSDHVSHGLTGIQPFADAILEGIAEDLEVPCQSQHPDGNSRSVARTEHSIDQCAIDLDRAPFIYSVLGAVIRHPSSVIRHPSSVFPTST